VEPIYLQAQTSQLPELKRVVVVNGNDIAMEPTLSRSLDVIFGRAAASQPTAGPGVGSSGPPAPPTPAPGTPAPSATVQLPTPTPQPAVTPSPAGTPGNVADLARQADAAYQRAQEALRNGDFATYGQQIALVESLIKQIVQQSSGQ
jgi:uncharacterized membrane protein (UPF0182 family)